MYNKAWQIYIYLANFCYKNKGICIISAETVILKSSKSARNLNFQNLFSWIVFLFEKKIWRHFFCIHGFLKNIWKVVLNRLAEVPGEVVRPMHNGTLSNLLENFLFFFSVLKKKTWRTSFYPFKLENVFLNFIQLKMYENLKWINTKVN